MSQVCPSCRRNLDFAGVPLSFCGFCGARLSPPEGGGTSGPFAPPTEVPSDDPDATSPLPPRVWLGDVPERLGSYRLLRRLGQGGMGTVYEGEDEATGRRVAVKLIDVQASPEALRRFRLEGKIASGVAHPRCVFVVAVAEDAGRPYIVLELMPGRTLDDLVRERGPLPVEEAIGHALDLIEGLEQVHAVGVIHRDIKPSNSFLDAQGRVKVGDFGLARSLAPEAKLTQTGTFVGTPLFASPEQVKGDALDARADLYSVCATLYFLLTGRAPHQSGDRDALAVMARVVSEDAPAVRSFRPDLPRGLERVLARGLARGRDKRYPDLASLRSALEGFGPSRAGPRALAARATAYLADVLLLVPLGWLAAWWLEGEAFADPGSVAGQVGFRLVAFAYFALAEGLAGCTPGKLLLGLRVWGIGAAGPPGLARAAIRAAVWALLFHSPAAVLLLAYGDRFPLPLRYGLPLAGALVALATARRHNGYRCLHDVASATRVVAVPPVPRPVAFAVAPTTVVARPDGLPEWLGSFRLHGELRRTADERVLLAVDAALDRLVWLWLRPPERAALSAGRRDLFVESRLRWLAGGGEHGGQRWDAFLAPGGSSVADLVAREGALSWEQARPLLTQLATELARASAEGTLPETLSLAQVWVLPHGQLVLLDAPLLEPRSGAATPLDLVADAAALLLTGTAPLDRPPAVVLPPAAGHLLAGLPRFGGAAGDLGTFRDALAAQADRPARVTLQRRACHLGLLVLALLGLGGFFWLGIFGDVASQSALYDDVKQSEARAAALEPFAVSTPDRAAGMTGLMFDPWARLVGSFQCAAEIDRRNLERNARAERIRYDERKLSMGWLNAVLLDAILGGEQTGRDRPVRAALHRLFTHQSEFVKDRFDLGLGSAFLLVLALCVPPSAFVGCAFVFRGACAVGSPGSRWCAPTGRSRRGGAAPGAPCWPGYRSSPRWWRRACSTRCTGRRGRSARNGSWRRGTCAGPRRGWPPRCRWRRRWRRRRGACTTAWRGRGWCRGERPMGGG